MILVTYKKVSEIEVVPGMVFTKRQKNLLQGMGSLMVYGSLPSNAPSAGGKRRGRRKAEIKD